MSISPVNNSNFLASLTNKSGVPYDLPVALELDPNLQSDLKGLTILQQIEARALVGEIGVNVVAGNYSAVQKELPELKQNYGETVYAEVVNVLVKNLQKAPGVLLDIGLGPATEPTNLSGIAASSSVVDLNWQEATNPNITGFEVLRQSVSGGSPQLIATLGPNATSYADTSVSAGSAYTYEVIALSPTGNSPPATTEVSTPASGTPAAEPTSLGAIAVSSSEIDLSWSEALNPNITGFEIMREAVIGGSFQTIATLGPNANSYADTSVSASTNYAYEVIALSPTGNSPPATIEVSTPAASGGGGGTGPGA
jgi:hypothetical protein